MLNSETINKILKQADKAAFNHNAAVERELLRYYKETLLEIQAELNRYELKGVLAWNEMQYYNRLTTLTENIRLIINDLTGKVARTINKDITGVYRLNYIKTGAVLSEALGSSFGSVNADAVRKAVENKLDLIKWSERLKTNQEKYVSDIRSAITQGLIQGKGYGQIARDIKTRSDIGAGKSLRIARTETHRVQNQARKDGIQKTKAAAERQGFDVVEVWDAAEDSRTRPDHARMDGVEANSEGKFDYFGIMVDGPGMVGIPEADINCRCTIRVDVKDI